MPIRQILFQKDFPMSVQNTDISIVSKMSIKTLGINPRAHVVPGINVVVARIYGYAKSIKVVEDKEKGESFDSIIGQFRGENLVPREGQDQMFESSVLYLPTALHGLLIESVRASEGADVEFALEISVQEASSKAGFAYVGRSILPSKVKSPLEGLTAIVQKHINAKILDGSKSNTPALPA